MVYMGSKNRISKDLLKIIEPYLSVDKKYYEPFVGGANMIDKIPKDKCKKIIGNDYNKYLIALLNKMKNNPEEIIYNFIEKEDYLKIREDFKNNNIKYLEDWEIGYLGFTKTFSGMFMHSYAGNKNEDKKYKRNYQIVLHNNIIKQSKNIKHIDFIYGDYKDMEIEDNSVVYIDGPYKDKTKYEVEVKYEELYEWIRNLVYNKNCVVFISEYNMPDDFECVWKKTLNTGLGNKKQSEKLFILEGEK